MERIQSFKTFSEIKTQESAKKLEEEVTAKRQKISERVSEILKEMEVSSLEEMEQDQKKEFVKRLFTEDKADDIEDEINKMGEPKKLDTPSKEKEEEAKDVSEGNAFIYAAAKAKGEGKSEFEFQGKTYKVTLKKNPLTESQEVLIEEKVNENMNWKVVDSKGNLVAGPDFKHIMVSYAKQKRGWKAVKIQEASENLKESKEEQIAMEIYAKVAGPEGEYSEGELVKADSAKFDEIVKDAGHSGSKAKKVAKELEKIAKANESVEINEWIVRDMDAIFDTDDDLEYVKKIAKKAGVKVDYDPEGNAPYAGSLTLSAKNPKAILKVAKVTGHDMDIEDGVYTLEESVKINESEDINSAEEFKSYAITVLKNAFDDDYDDEKANDVIDGLIKKYKDDFGAMVGALQASLD